MTRWLARPINWLLYHAINALDRATRGDTRRSLKKSRDTYAAAWSRAQSRSTMLCEVMAEAATRLDAITQDTRRVIRAGALHDELTEIAQVLRDAARAS